MNIISAIFRFFATMFSPLRHPGATGGGRREPVDVNADLDMADVKARRKKMTAITAVVVIVGSLVSLYYTMNPATPKINRAPFIGLGQVLADETAKAIGDRGRVVLVIAEYHERAGTPMNDQLVEFRKTLKGHTGIEITATEVVAINKIEMMPGLSTKAFNDLLKKHSSVNGLVIFIGLPMLEREPTLEIPARHPKIIAIQTSSPATKPYFERQIADVLIVPRMSPADSGTTPPATSRSWFDKYFEVITAKNYQALPY
ncbi:MAG: hypothetical protein WCS70_12245 [Verrucomicrobiota bacterium]